MSECVYPCSTHWYLCIPVCMSVNMHHATRVTIYTTSVFLCQYFTYVCSFLCVEIAVPCVCLHTCTPCLSVCMDSVFCIVHPRLCICVPCLFVCSMYVCLRCLCLFVGFRVLVPMYPSSMWGTPAVCVCAYLQSVGFVFHRCLWYIWSAVCEER